jgi:surfactin synthase thioesterase subunit
MMGAYRPQTLAVPIVHLIGDDVQMSTKVLNDPRLGWRDFAGLQFDVRRVPGDHVSIFSEDNAPGLAAEFMAALRAVEPETRASVMAAS